MSKNVLEIINDNLNEDAKNICYDIVKLLKNYTTPNKNSFVTINKASIYIKNGDEISRGNIDNLDNYVNIHLKKVSDLLQLLVEVRYNSFIDIGLKINDPTHINYVEDLITEYENKTGYKVVINKPVSNPSMIYIQIQTNEEVYKNNVFKYMKKLNEGNKNVKLMGYLYSDMENEANQIADEIRMICDDPFDSEHIYHRVVGCSNDGTKGPHIADLKDALVSTPSRVGSIVDGSEHLLYQSNVSLSFHEKYEGHHKEVEKLIKESGIIEKYNLIDFGITLGVTYKETKLYSVHFYTPNKKMSLNLGNIFRKLNESQDNTILHMVNKSLNEDAKEIIDKVTDALSPYGKYHENYTTVDNKMVMKYLRPDGSGETSQWGTLDLDKELEKGKPEIHQIYHENYQSIHYHTKIGMVYSFSKREEYLKMCSILDKMKEDNDFKYLKIERKHEYEFYIKIQSNVQTSTNNTIAYFKKLNESKILNFNDYLSSYLKSR